MIAHGLPIYVALEPVDMRLGAERLGALVRERMRTEPRSRALFVFVGKRPTRVKVLWWERNGYCLLYKRLHRALFRLPPSAAGAASVRIDGAGLAALLGGVENPHARS